MTPDSTEVTLGEIYRMCQASNGQLAALTAEVRERHHKLANDVHQMTGPLSELKVKIAAAEGDIDQLAGEVAAVAKQANQISGAGAILALIVSLIPWPWKQS